MAARTRKPDPRTHAGISALAGKYGCSIDLLAQLAGVNVETLLPTRAGGPIPSMSVHAVTALEKTLGELASRGTDPVAWLGEPIRSDVPIRRAALYTKDPHALDALHAGTLTADAALDTHWPDWRTGYLDRDWANQTAAATEPATGSRASRRRGTKTTTPKTTTPKTTTPKTTTPKTTTRPASSSS